MSTIFEVNFVEGWPRGIPASASRNTGLQASAGCDDCVMCKHPFPPRATNNARISRRCGGIVPVSLLSRQGKACKESEVSLGNVREACLSQICFRHCFRQQLRPSQHSSLKSLRHMHNYGPRSVPHWFFHSKWPRSCSSSCRFLNVKTFSFKEPRTT